jgi:hypothetical protein
MSHALSEDIRSTKSRSMNIEIKHHVGCDAMYSGRVHYVCTCFGNFVVSEIPAIKYILVACNFQSLGDLAKLKLDFYNIRQRFFALFTKIFIVSLRLINCPYYYPSFQDLCHVTGECVRGCQQYDHVGKLLVWGHCWARLHSYSLHHDLAQR